MLQAKMWGGRGSRRTCVRAIPISHPQPTSPSPQLSYFSDHGWGSRGSGGHRISLTGAKYTRIRDFWALPGARGDSQTTSLGIGNYRS